MSAKTRDCRERAHLWARNNINMTRRKPSATAASSTALLSEACHVEVENALEVMFVSKSSERELKGIPGASKRPKEVPAVRLRRIQKS